MSILIGLDDGGWKKEVLAVERVIVLYFNGMRILIGLEDGGGKMEVLVVERIADL